MRKITYSIKNIYYIHATIEGLKGEFCTSLNTEDFNNKDLRLHFPIGQSFSIFWPIVELVDISTNVCPV